MGKVGATMRSSKENNHLGISKNSGIRVIIAGINDSLKVSEAKQLSDLFDKQTTHTMGHKYRQSL
jgi:hypothetical protein